LLARPHYEPGTWVLGVLADEANRAILLALADGPLRPIEIDRHLPGLARSATRRRLSYLLADGILTRTHHGRQVRYALGPGARHLGLITTLAGRWEWKWSEPPSTGDIPGLLHLLAPVARIPEPLSGVCRVHIDASGTDPEDIYLRAQAGTLIALRAAPEDPPHAVGHAPPKAWCDALVERNPTGIMTSGNTGLMIGVLMSVSTALVTP
jgi:DNA-binding HxlR family transcriptional regulator